VSVCVCVLICGDLPACSPLGLFAQEIGRSRKLSIYICICLSYIYVYIYTYIYIYAYACACVLIGIYWDTMVMCHGEDGLQSLVDDLQVRTGTTSAAAYLRALGCVGLGAQGLQTSSIPGIFAVQTPRCQKLEAVSILSSWHLGNHLVPNNFHARIGCGIGHDSMTVALKWIETRGPASMVSKTTLICGSPWNG